MENKKKRGRPLWIAFKILSLRMIRNLRWPANTLVGVVNSFQNFIFKDDSQQIKAFIADMKGCE